MTLEFQLAFIAGFFVLAILLFRWLVASVSLRSNSWGYVASFVVLVLAGYYYVGCFTWELYVYCGGKRGPIPSRGHASYYR